MGTSRGLWATALLSLGAAGLVFAILPGAWPNPLPEGPIDAEFDVLQLWAAAAAVDAACYRGDLVAFDAVVTPAHRQRLQQQLAAFDRTLDSSTLRDFSLDRDRDYSEMLNQPVMAGEVFGKRAAIVVQRPGGDGAQLLSFLWDGKVLRLDDSRHVTAVRSKANARAAVADAVGSRSR